MQALFGAYLLRFRGTRFTGLWLVNEAGALEAVVGTHAKLSYNSHVAERERERERERKRSYLHANRIHKRVQLEQR